MDLMDYRRKIIANSPHLSHAEGAVATFSDGTDLPLKSLLVDIEPVQSGSGDPSPSNIRPISGWEAVGVTRTGKNLFGGIALAETVTNASNIGEINTEAKTFTFNHGEYENGSPVRSLFNKFQGGRVTVIITYSNSGKNTSLIVRYTDGANGQIQLVNTSGAKSTIVFTSNANKQVRDVCLSYYADALTTVFYEESGFFDGVIIASDFTPYTGTSVTIDLGRTVYGGTRNVLTGELVVDMAMVDMGTLTWTYSNGFFRANPNPEYKRPSSQRSTINAFCTIYKNTTWNDVGSGDKEYAFSSAVTRPEIIIKDSDYTTSAAFKTAMSGVMLVYELATPQTYQLDPQTVRSLYGQNNIWADTGNVALEYWAHA